MEKDNGIVWTGDVVNGYVELEDEARITCLHPRLAQLCAPVRHRDVLDFGCGDGLFIRNYLIPAAPRSIVGIDRNGYILEYARRNLGSSAGNTRLCLLEGDERDVEKLGTFDVIVCSLVLMMVKKWSTLQSIIGILLDHLDAKGKLVVSVTHPCFREASHPTMTNIMPRHFTYWSSGTPYEVVLRSPKRGKEVRFTDIHWTLEDYVSAIWHAGGMVEKIVEVAGNYDRKGSPLGDPAYVVFVVKKKREWIGRLVGGCVTGMNGSRELFSESGRRASLVAMTGPRGE